jgi:hypothetical protein
VSIGTGYSGAFESRDEAGDDVLRLERGERLALGEVDRVEHRRLVSVRTSC